MLNIDDRIFDQIKDENQMWLLLHIAKRINSDMSCFPKNSTLAKDCGWGINKVQKVKKQLKDMDLINISKRTVKGQQGANLYTVTTDHIGVFVSLRKLQGTPKQGTPKQGTPKQGNISINHNEVLKSKKSINHKNSASSLFDEAIESTLSKFFQDKKNVRCLLLPDQPSRKTFDRWSATYSEDYIEIQILKFEEFCKNKKNSAKKIKSCSRTLNNFLKNDWISDKDQRSVFEIWRQWWNNEVKLPFSFDFFHTSQDRQATSACLAFLMSAQGDNYKEYFRQILDRLPDFWKGKRLPSIVKNLTSIVKDIERQGKGGQRAPSKQSATITNTDWI